MPSSLATCLLVGSISVAIAGAALWLVFVLVAWAAVWEVIVSWPNT